MTPEQSVIKDMKEILYDAKKDAKLDYCLYCGKKCSSFCNSHTIPQFILKNILKEGYIYTQTIYLNSPISEMLPKEKGLKDIETFKNICKECDNTIFKEYENLENLSSEPSNKIMTEIALKNFLMLLYKNSIEKHIVENIAQKNQKLNNLMKLLQYIDGKNSTEKDIKHDFKRCQTILKKNLKSGYKLMFWHKLNHIVPIAFQGAVCLYGDLSGNVLNKDLYTYSDQPTKKLEFLHICVFPLKDFSIIMAFYHKDDHECIKFNRQFNRLNLVEKMRLIGFILFSHEESVYISKKNDHEFLNDCDLKKASNNIETFSLSTLKESEAKYTARKNELSNYKSFPNIFDEKYRI